MSLDENIVSEIIKDGVKVITYKNGSQHFEVVDHPEIEIQVDDRSWWQKVKDWWKNSKIKPYVKVRDLANPFGDRTDPDAGSDGRNGYEAGIKMSF